MVSFHIAKAEWRKLFFSPIAWLLLIIFVVQANVLVMNDFLTFSSATGESTGNNLSELIYNGLFKTIQAYLYLYVPLLTMGLMSEELSNKTINLMYSSPISNRQIVMGKYLAMVGYGLLLCVVLLVDVLLGVGAIRDFEWGMVTVGLLGIFLLFCTYAAIGLFMSSLISYQLIAAIGTFAVFAILNIVGPWGRNYAFFRDITYWLSINSRADAFATGLLITEGIVYFVVISALFIVLTIFRLNAVRQKIPFVRTVGKNLVAIVVTCLIGYFSAQPGWIGYWDATSRKTNTLHPTAQKILAEVPEDATITLYTNVIYDGGVSPAQVLNDKHGMFARFLRFKPNIKFEYVSFYDSVLNDPVRASQRKGDLREQMEETAERYVDKKKVLSPEEIHKIIDLTPEENRSVRQIVLSDGRSSWLRTFYGSVGPMETAIAISFKRLTTPSLLVGYAMESRYFDRMKDGFNFMMDEKQNYFSVINSGFDFCKLSLNDPVPDSVAILVVADLSAALTGEQERHLQEYVDRGGDLILLAEPRNREIMNPLLRKFGFEMGEGILAQRKELYGGETRVEDLVLTSITPEAKSLSLFFDAEAFRVSPTAWVYGCAPLVCLEDAGFEVTPLLQSDTMNTWNELQQEYITEEYDVEYNPETGERKDSFVTAVALSREVNGKTQKILLSGDADMLSNRSKSWFSPAYGNRTFIDGITYWFTDGEYPLDMRTPQATDDVFNYSESTVKALKVGFVYVLPGLLAVSFLILWFRRRAR